MKAKRKNIKKKKLDVWLKCGELEKYLSLKKRLVNKTIYMPNKKFDMACTSGIYMSNCKLIITRYWFSFGYQNKNNVFKNSIFLGNYRNEHDIYISNYKDRQKFKNKGL